MAIEYIKDNMGRIVGTQTTTDNRTYTNTFAGKVVASYNPNNNNTTSIQDNKNFKGDQSLRFLKK